jgi:hypothetical protein
VLEHHSRSLDQARAYRIAELKVESRAKIQTTYRVSTQLAEVDVDPDEEVVNLHILHSCDEARDVYRAVGGDLAQLEALLAADTDTQ